MTAIQRKETPWTDVCIAALSVTLLLLHSAWMVVDASAVSTSPAGGPASQTMLAAEGLHDGRMARLLDAADLSAGQRTAVDQLLETHRPQIRAGFESIRAAREAFRHELVAATFDQAAVRHAAQRTAVAEERMLQLQASVFNEIRPLLTAEQLQALSHGPSDSHVALMSTLAARAAS